MITTLGRDELIAQGARHRADYLVEQAGYTLGLAAGDGQALADELPDGYLDEVKAVLGEVTAAKGDKALVAVESKDATREQNDAIKEAKVWRRKVARRAARARRMGQVIPDDLLVVSQARTTPALMGQVAQMVKLFEANLAKMHGKGKEALLAEGKALAGMLGSADATQEVKRLSQLSQVAKDFYERKGLLYVGLKVLNDAGHELHANDPNAAARYSLSILHRRGAARVASPKEKGAAATA